MSFHERTFSSPLGHFNTLVSFAPIFIQLCPQAVHANFGRSNRVLAQDDMQIVKDIKYAIQFNYWCLCMIYEYRVFMETANHQIHFGRKRNFNYLEHKRWSQIMSFLRLIGWLFDVLTCLIYFKWTWTTNLWI
jgi:hypothetical protein